MRLINASRVKVSLFVVSVVVDLTRLWKVDFESMRLLSSTAEVGRLFCCRCCAEARRSLMLAREGGIEAMVWDIHYYGMSTVLIGGGVRLDSLIAG